MQSCVEKISPAKSRRERPGGDAWADEDECEQVRLTIPVLIKMSEDAFEEDDFLEGSKAAFDHIMVTNSSSSSLPIPSVSPHHLHEIHDIVTTRRVPFAKRSCQCLCNAAR
jgi:hypothetical protein